MSAPNLQLWCSPDSLAARQREALNVDRATTGLVEGSRRSAAQAEALHRAPDAIAARALASTYEALRREAQRLADALGGG